MRSIKSALIGCGRMGAFVSDSVKNYSPKSWFPLSHIEALIRCPNTDLVSICDKNPALLSKAVDHYGIENYFEDYRKMFDVTKPELLCIATRTSERSEIIKDTINAGIKAIHLEKPICNSVKQLEELFSLVKNNDISLTYGTIRRYFDIYTKAKKIVDSGELGYLQEIEVNFGPAQLFWTHPHSVDTILYFAGSRKISSVEAGFSNFIRGQEDDVIISDPQIEEATINFEDGCVGKITTRLGMDVTLYCSSGRVIVEGDGRSVVVFKLNNSKAYFEFPGEVFIKDNERPEGTMAAILRLVNQLSPETTQTNCMPVFDKKHIFKGQRVLFGFVQSYLDKKGPVALNDIRPSLYVFGKTGEFYA